MLSVTLQDMAFTTVGCCRRLAEMHISAAQDGVSLYGIAFITKDFLRSYVRRAHLLMPFLLCAVYLS